MNRIRIVAVAMVLAAAAAAAPLPASACDQRILGSCPIEPAMATNDNVAVAADKSKSFERSKARRRGVRSARSTGTRVRFQRRASVRARAKNRQAASRGRSKARRVRSGDSGMVGQMSSSEREAVPPLPPAAPRTSTAKHVGSSGPAITLPLPMDPPGGSAAPLAAPPVASSLTEQPQMGTRAPRAPNVSAQPAPAAVMAVQQAAERAQREAAEREVGAAARAAAKAEDPGERATLRTVFIALAGVLALATCARLVIG